MRIEMVEEIFNEAKRDGADICVELTIPDFEETEFIINRNKSLDRKLDYYKKSFDKNCININDSNIKIVSVTAIEFCCEI